MAGRFIGFIVFVFLLFSITAVVFAVPNALLVVRDVPGNSGETRLELFYPDQGLSIPLTEGFFQISFPVVCEATGLIGFTHHDQSMKASVWVFDPGATQPRKAVDNAILEDISPDGKTLLVSSASSSPSLYLVELQTRHVQQISENLLVTSASFSPTGDKVAFAAMGSGGMLDLYLLPLPGGEPVRLTQSAQVNEYYPSFSSDGKYLMFMTDRTGSWGVDYFNMETMDRFQANLWGMFPSLSADDSWTALEDGSNIAVSLTNGNDRSVLTAGKNPAWISTSNASRFRSSASTPPVQPPVSSPGTTTGALLASMRVGPEGGEVEARGKIRVVVPAGTVETTGELQVHQVSVPALPGSLFELDWQNAPGLFSKMVTIEVPVPASMDPESVVAVEELAENTWLVVPSQYDSRTNTVSFQTAHFSKKGIVSEIAPSHIRKIFSGAVGAFATAGAIIFLTGSTAITVPVLGTVAAGALLFGGTEIANPLLDRAYELAHGLNRTVAVGDGVFVSWVDDPKNASHLAGDRYFVCVEKSTRKIMLFMDDPKITSEQRAAAMTSLFPGSRYELLHIPKVVLQLGAEMTWVKNFYSEKGYSLPPTTDIWIYKMNTSGGWNGTRLEIDLEYFADDSESTKASRMVTLAHEYWHSVFQHGEFSPEFKWLDECMATTFESQVLPEAKKWYDQTIIPKYEHFYDMYPADKFAISLRTGFVMDGTSGTDADRIKRGYQLWPWGKFILDGQDNDAVRQLLTNSMDEAYLSALFGQFSRSLLIQELEIPADMEESVELDGKMVNYFTKSGWPALTVPGLTAASILVPGNSAAHFSSGVYHKPVPLSMLLMTFKSPKTSTPSPLVIRRSTPDPRETFLALHPDRKDPATGRRALADTESGDGVLVLPKDWGPLRQGSQVQFPLALINAAVEENWSEYLGYGENPIYAYYLLPPRDLSVKSSGEGFLLQWNEPSLGEGLDGARCLKAYHVFFQKSGQKAVFHTTVGIDKLQLSLTALQTRGYDRVGVACEDKVAKDGAGNGLLSEIAWVDLASGQGAWVKRGESFAYGFGEGFTNNQSGGGASAQYSDDCYDYSVQMGSTSARTSLLLTAKGWNCPSWTNKGELASFSHSWSQLPDRLVPGQSLNITVSVSDAGCEGKYAPLLYGSTEFRANGMDAVEVEAGGMMGSSTISASWEASKQKTFQWKVPEPDAISLHSPSQYPLRVSVTVKARGSNASTGYYTCEYVYSPTGK